MSLKLPENYSYIYEIGICERKFAISEKDAYKNFLDQLSNINNLNLILFRSPYSTKKYETVTSYICHHGNAKRGELKQANFLSNRSKKIECKFKILVEIGIDKANFTIFNEHNHSISSAHALSFAKISEDTIQKMHQLFDKKLTPSKAKKEIESGLSEMEKFNRSTNPTTQDIFRHFYKWKIAKYGESNGPKMFELLEEHIRKYENGHVFYTSNSL